VRYTLGYLDVDGRIILKWILKRDLRVWARIIRLKIMSSGGILQMRVLNLFTSTSTKKVKQSRHTLEALGGRGGIGPTHSRPRH
jgi:hypothetical protein